MAVFKDGYTGTWCCKFRYKEWNGTVKQHKKCGFKTQREAKEYERKYVDKMTGSSEITFEGLVENYLEDFKARYRITTYDMKKHLIYKHLIPFFGKYRIMDITPVIVRAWQTQLINDEQCYKPTYLKTIHNQLSAIMNYGVKLYGLKQNPCRVAGAMGKSKAESMAFWTLSEFSQFIRYFEDEPMQKVGFTILFFSGIRIGELLALTYADFNFTDNTMRINKSYAKVTGEDVISLPKTPKSIRTISMPASVMNMVGAYFTKCNTYDISCRLFPVRRGCFEKSLKRACESTGVKQIRVHDIRHSHASMLMNMGVPIKQISERLGHENIETTLETYAHLYEEKEKELRDKLEFYASKIAK